MLKGLIDGAANVARPAYCQRLRESPALASRLRVVRWLERPGAAADDGYAAVSERGARIHSSRTKAAPVHSESLRRLLAAQHIPFMEVSVYLPDKPCAVDATGPVRYIVSQNKLHHLFLRQWSTFLHRSQARAARERVLAWNPSRLLIAHGNCARAGAAAIIADALRWM